MKKIFPVIVLSGLISCYPVESCRGEDSVSIVLEENLILEKYPQLEDIAKEFHKRGIDIEKYFSDPHFEIYENIDRIFKTSPETVALSQVQKAKTDEEKQVLFDEQYNIYKEKLDLNRKKVEIVNFIKDNYKLLGETEKEYKIPKEIIASVLGIESSFGRNIGRYYAFNSFVSMLAKDCRTEFASTQLEELLEFCNKKDVEVFELKSSYAGAVGFGQFIPSSLNIWFKGDDVYSMEDNIVSVANYLSYFNIKTNSIKGALFNYNRSDVYVRAVMDLADSVKDYN
jgi:membrane-bound lytic murein transglycosylase B